MKGKTYFSTPAEASRRQEALYRAVTIAAKVQNERTDDNDARIHATQAAAWFLVASGRLASIDSAGPEPLIPPGPQLIARMLETRRRRFGR